MHKGSNLTNPIQKKRGAEELIDTAFADNQPWNFEFKGHEYKEREPRIPLQKGDLLVRKSEDGRKLDLVTSVGHRTMEVISGDYNDSVVKREVPLDTDGTPQDENRYPGFLRLE